MEMRVLKFAVSLAMDGHLISLELWSLLVEMFCAACGIRLLFSDRGVHVWITFMYHYPTAVMLTRTRLTRTRTRTRINITARQRSLEPEALTVTPASARLRVFEEFAPFLIKTATPFLKPHTQFLNFRICGGWIKTLVPIFWRLWTNVHEILWRCTDSL